MIVDFNSESEEALQVTSILHLFISSDFLWLQTMSFFKKQSISIPNCIGIDAAVKVSKRDSQYNAFNLISTLLIQLQARN